jgi:FKBP-type peptidyl-prolyl cis-trans isomerase
MSRRPGLALSFAAAALLGLPAAGLAQDKDESVVKKGGAATTLPMLPPKAKDEPPPEVKGSRFRLKLKNGNVVEGVLPEGLVWEKLGMGGEYDEATETEKGAGIRLHYALGMEGHIFILRADIAEMKDLGALTDEQRLAIQKQVLDQRRKAQEEREKAFRAEMDKLAKAEREQAKKEAEEAKAKAEGKTVEKKPAASAADEARGDDLLKRFPAPEWGQKRLKDILQREVVNGIFRNDLEKEFIDNFKLWKDAYDRQLKAEGKEPEPLESDAKKETPPAKVGK